MIEHARDVPHPLRLKRASWIGGFAHAQVLALADQIVEAVKKGCDQKIRRDGSARRSG